jgi:hypothetical protein
MAAGVHTPMPHLRLFLLLASLLLAPLDAGAQVKPPGERGRLDETPPQTEDRDTGRIMLRVLPFLDGQVMRYYTAEGGLEAYARRRGLTIRFYDPANMYLGRAERVSQTVTRYYAADGSYLGRRINQRLTTASQIHHYDPPGTGQDNANNP